MTDVIYCIPVAFCLVCFQLSREPQIKFVNCISFVCRFSLTRSRVAVLKGNQFFSQLFEAQNCCPRSHLLHFYLPLFLFFQPPLKRFKGAGVSYHSTVGVYGGFRPYKCYKSLSALGRL